MAAGVSTRMRRINWDETAKKWARFCHCILVVDESHVSFVHQGCGLQAVTGALATHVAAGEAVEFVINDGGQPVERGSISVAPGSKQPAHFRICRIRRGLVHRFSESLTAPRTGIIPRLATPSKIKEQSG